MSGRAVLLAGFVLLSLVIVGEASRRQAICFKCKSWEDPTCWDLKVNDTRFHRYSYLCDDEEIPPGAQTFCRTIHQKIRDGNGTERLWRKCGWVEYLGRYNRDCYTYSDGHHEETVCQCFEDNCNSATVSSLAPFAFTAAIIACVKTLRQA